MCKSMRLLVDNFFYCYYVRSHLILMSKAEFKKKKTSTHTDTRTKKSIR